MSSVCLVLLQDRSWSNTGSWKNTCQVRQHCYCRHISVCKHCLRGSTLGWRHCGQYVPMCCAGCSRLWWAVTVALFLIETLGSEFAVAVRCISMSLLRGMSIDCCCRITLLLLANISLQALFTGLYTRLTTLWPIWASLCCRLLAVVVGCYCSTLSHNVSAARNEHRLLLSNYVYNLLTITKHICH